MVAAPVDPVQAAQEGRELVDDLLKQKPAQSSKATGVMTIRKSGSSMREVPVEFNVVVQSNQWLNICRASLANGGWVKLTVTHADGQPNRYELVRSDSVTATNIISRTLTGGETMVPFAGSDFWVSDLGLEFLHWPQQRVLQKGTRKGRPSRMLESVNPQPAPGGYARVESWLDNETGGVLHADAYDSRGEKIKQFDPKGVRKVQGQWELAGMAIQDLKADSRTRIQFGDEDE